MNLQDHVIKRSYGRKLLVVFNHPVTFAGHSYCGSGDITYIICRVSLQDHAIKVLSDFMEGSSSLYVTTLLGLVVIGIVVVEIFF